MNQFSLIIVYLAIWLGLTSSIVSSPAMAQSLLPVGNDITSGISGMTLLTSEGGSLSFLIVHDNKKGPEEARLAIAKMAGDYVQYFPLEWPTSADLPQDLEAITKVPGEREPTFMAMSSDGKLYHFQLSEATHKVALIATLKVPKDNPKENLEGFDLQELDGQLVAVWAHRGQDADPGVIYWGLLDLVNNEITKLGSVEIQVPLLASNLRHISDLKVDSAGIVYISSATDNGNDGPFESAIYIGGIFGTQDSKISFQKNQALVPWHHFEQYKVEGIELVPGAKGGVFVGTDDENKGSRLGKL